MITIIGAGNAGKALGKAFLRAGYDVHFGVSSVSKYQEVIHALGGRATLSDVSEALEIKSEITVLAVPYRAALEVASLNCDWQGRILVDISTPWLPDMSGLAVGLNNSAAETIAKVAHNAKVVKAFNTMGAECFENPSIVEGQVFAPVCSDDLIARQKIMRLGDAIGLNTVDAGELKNARATEPLVLLWLQLTFNLPLGRSFEFGLLTKQCAQV